MSLYRNIIRPFMFRLDAEKAHHLGLGVLRRGLSAEFAQNLARRRFGSAAGPGPLERFGLTFGNPLGVAAGFDKNGLVVRQLAALGFGFVEVGTVTYEPQPGNERPRMFRLEEDGALINRLGFNNDGTRRVVGRLQAIDPGCVVGVNIGRNKDVPNEAAVANYLQSFDLAFEAADYIAVNVSSPNTPDLRELQRAESLSELLGALLERNRKLAADRETDRRPLLVKIAPDLDEGGIEAIVDISRRLGIDGIIATNTTVSRDDLRTAPEVVSRIGAGGLSGRPVRARSDEVIARIHRASGGELPIIGVGGIFTAADAFEKIRAGACLLQAYTGFVYRGPAFAREINTGLARILRERGFRSLDEAVGSGAGAGG